MYSLQELLPYASLVSLAISSCALFFTAYNSILARRNGENDGILKIWEKYDAYCFDIDAATSEIAKDILFRKMLNYVENICFLYNKKRVSAEVRRNIGKLVSDFLYSVDKEAPVEQVLRELDPRAHAFSEIMIFYRSRDFGGINV